MQDDGSKANETTAPLARFDRDKWANNLLRRSTEGEAIHLHTRVTELDLEPARGDRSRLADELVCTLIVGDPTAVGVHVDAVRAVPRLTIEEDPERDRRSLGCRSHDEVEVTCVELDGDASAGLVRHRGVPGHGPGPREPPNIEREPCGRGVAGGLVEPGDLFLREAGALTV